MILHCYARWFHAENVVSAKMSDQERIRIVLLGDSAVGKSAIIKRFLFNTYSDKYRTTIEDLFSKEFDLGATTIKVSA